jgi:hypothetical protein
VAGSCAGPTSNWPHWGIGDLGRSYWRILSVSANGLALQYSRVVSGGCCCCCCFWIGGSARVSFGASPRVALTSAAFLNLTQPLFRGRQGRYSPAGGEGGSLSASILGRRVYFPNLSTRRATGRFSRALGREDRIRQNLLGFEQFQSPPDVEELMDLAEFGPLLQSMPSLSRATPSSSRTTILEQSRSLNSSGRTERQHEDVLWCR